MVQSTKTSTSHVSRKRSRHWKDYLSFRSFHLFTCTLTFLLMLTCGGLGETLAHGGNALIPLGATDLKPVQNPERSGSIRLFDFAEFRLDRENRSYQSISDWKQLLAEKEPRILQTRPISDFVSKADGKHFLPTFSADGDKLAFATQTGPDAKMLVYDFETTLAGQVQISRKTDAPRIRRRPSIVGQQSTQETENSRRAALELVWSPDGQHYAFVSEGKVYLGMPQVPEPYLLAEHSGFPAYSPRWSPDGKKLVYTSDLKNQLYLLSDLDLFLSRLKQAPALDHSSVPSEAQKQPLTTDEDSTGFATWLSPSQFIYETYRDGTNQFDLREMNLSHPTQRRWRVDLLDEQRWPQVSPDKKHLAYYSNRWLDQQRVPGNPDRYTLYVTKLSQDKATAADQFTKEAIFLPQVYKDPVVWSPDSKYLLYIPYRAAEKFPVYAHNYESNTMQRLTGPDEDHCEAVELARGTGKLIVFSIQDKETTFQKLYVGVVNFPVGK